MIKKTKNEIIAIAQSKVNNSSFASKAAQKDALGYLNDAYRILEDNKNRDGLEQSGYSWWDMPMSLHQIKPKHKPIIESAGISWDEIVELVLLRNMFKDMPIVKPEPKAKAEPKGNQATHIGTCQVCLCAHKVNNKTGKLAAHGYKMVGYQEGECEGSHELPLQKSFDALEKIISSSKIQIKNYNEMMASGETTVTIHFYRKPKKQISIQKIVSNLEANIRMFQERIDGWKPEELRKVGA